MEPQGGLPGCGTAEISIPDKSPAYYAAHPDEFMPDPDMPAGLRATLNQIAEKQPTVSTSITCTPGAAHKRPDQGDATSYYNWSGYGTGATSTTYSFVTLNWTVPSVTGTSSNSDVAVWPGLGSGSTTDELVQAGTAQASTSTTFWYEMFPYQPMQNISAAMSPGDSVTVSIGYNTSTNIATYNFYNSTKNTFTPITESLPSGQKFIGRQAEWIVERPSLSNGSYAVLPNFGTIYTGNAAYGTASTTYMATNANPFTMINASGQTMAAPGWVKNYVFTVSWYEAS